MVHAEAREARLSRGARSAPRFFAGRREDFPFRPPVLISGSNQFASELAQPACCERIFKEPTSLNFPGLEQATSLYPLMNQTARIPVVSVAPQSSSRGYWAVFAVLLLSVGAMLCVRYRSWPVDVEPERTVAGAPAQAVDWSAGIRSVRDQLGRIDSEVNEREAEVWAEFAGQWKAARARGVDRIQSSKMESVKALLSAEELTGLVVDFALDKVRGGERAFNRIEARSKPFFMALKEVAGAGEAEVQKAHEKLRELDNRFAQKIGAVVQDSEAKVPPQTFAALYNLREEVVRECVVNLGGTGVAVVAEAAFIATTAESVKVVSAWLGRILAPQILKAAGGISTIEIPVFDLVSLGLLIWTGYDVYSLPEKIRSELDAQFSNATDAQLKELDGAIDAAVESLKKQHRAARQKGLEQAEAALK